MENAWKTHCKYIVNFNFLLLQFVFSCMFSIVNDGDKVKEMTETVQRNENFHGKQVPEYSNPEVKKIEEPGKKPKVETRTRVEKDANVTEDPELGSIDETAKGIIRDAKQKMKESYTQPQGNNRFNKRVDTNTVNSH